MLVWGIWFFFSCFCCCCYCSFTNLELLFSHSFGGNMYLLNLKRLVRTTIRADSTWQNFVENGCFGGQNPCSYAFRRNQTASPVKGALSHPFISLYVVSRVPSFSCVFINIFKIKINQKCRIYGCDNFKKCSFLYRTCMQMIMNNSIEEIIAFKKWLEIKNVPILRWNWHLGNLH